MKIYTKKIPSCPWNLFLPGKISSNNKCTEKKTKLNSDMSVLFSGFVTLLCHGSQLLSESV